jgi:hypothetical protein
VEKIKKSRKFWGKTGEKTSELWGKNNIFFCAKNSGIFYVAI